MGAMLQLGDHASETLVRVQNRRACALPGGRHDKPCKTTRCPTGFRHNGDGLCSHNDATQAFLWETGLAVEQ